MYRIREVHNKDVSKIQKLAKLMLFINLPSDRAQLEKKCFNSQRAFSGKIKKLSEAHYMFALEEFKTKKIIGTSSILAQHGTRAEPHMYFKIGTKTHISKTTGKEFVHDTLKLQFDAKGPTEIAGLVMDPSYRKSTEKLGRFLSYVRFIYMGMYPNRFKKKVLAELMPPFLSNGSSILWEAVGRKFTNLTYYEADKLSRKNKEFITALFPKSEIYIELLPGNVRDVIGEVGPETYPVRRMLEQIGFRYGNMVDPFDGGPHYWVDFNKITVIRSICKGKVCEEEDSKSLTSYGIIANQGKKFFAVQSQFRYQREKVFLSEDAIARLGCEEGDLVWTMKYP